ncbi:MAG: YeeE/YedE thiosulfate transporter family protein [Desulfotignum sp.]|nr:YeeE/YedE thiosulfate transporter family protein [Desulfotignum sp.]
MVAGAYLAGALAGVVGILSVVIAGKYFGASTSFVRTAGMIEQFFGPDRVAQMDYFIRVVPKIDWQWMFMIGIILGAFISAVTSGSFKFQAVPDMWAERFGCRQCGQTGGFCLFRRGRGHIRGPAGRGLTQRSRVERYASTGGQRVYRAHLFLCRRHLLARLIYE